jgi:hypothetical protein
MNIQSIVDDLYSAFKQAVLTAVTKNTPALIDAASGYLSNEEKTLKDLASGVLNGELKADFVIRRLNEVKQDLVASLISLEQIIASDIEVLVNNLILLFEDLIKKAVLSINPA